MSDHADLAVHDGAAMLFGGHVKSVADIEFLRHNNFRFGEVILANAGRREYWRESGIHNDSGRCFFLVAHGPIEGPPNDIDNLWNKYYPALVETVDLVSEMAISFLTVHLWMDPRFVRTPILSEKKEILRQVVSYATTLNILIGLENLSETAEDFASILDAVPGLFITLDVGHGQLLTETNTSFGIIAQLMQFIRHVHIHDNRGGTGFRDDLHLPIGRGIVDFYGIMGELHKNHYQGTATLELEHEDLVSSMETLRRILEAVGR